MSLTARPTQISGTTGRPRLRADLSRAPSSTAGRRARGLGARTPTRSFYPLPGPPSGDLPPSVRALFAARIFTRALWPHVGDDREGLSPNLPTPAGACFGLMPRDLLGHLGYVVLALHDYPLPPTRGFPNRETSILRRSPRSRRVNTRRPLAGHSRHGLHGPTVNRAAPVRGGTTSLPPKARRSRARRYRGRECLDGGVGRSRVRRRGAWRERQNAAVCGISDECAWKDLNLRHPV